MLKKRIEDVSKFLKFDSYLAVETRGSSGGFALMCKSNADVSIFNYSMWHISAHVTSCLDSPTWCFTGFYGHQR